MNKDLDRFYKHLGAEECDDQLPLKARVGRGPKGDSFRVDVDDDTDSEAKTELVGELYDEAVKSWLEVWRSKNINGGRLYVSEAVRFKDNPKTFTLTFSYVRPGRKEWSFITPAIPFVYDDPRRGSDVADMYLKDHKYQNAEGECDMWKDVLAYDQDLPREKFNPPNPYGGPDKVSDTQLPEKHKGEGWSISLDIVEFVEFAKVLGWSYKDLVNSINWEDGKIKPLQGKLYTDTAESNLLDFIERLVKNEEEEREKEIERLETRIEHLETVIAHMQSSYETVLEKIIDKFYGSHKLEKTEKPIPEEPVDPPTTYVDYDVKFENDNKAAVGNMNVFSNPGSDEKAYALRTRADDTLGDIRIK